MVHTNNLRSQFIAIKNREDFGNAWHSDFLRKIREQASNSAFKLGLMRVLHEN